MHKHSIIRITAAAAGALLLAGCSARLDRPGSGEIRFEAGSALLRDDATKADAIKEGSSFTPGVDAIAVFGVRNTSESDEIIFNNQEVSLTSSGWQYTPPKSWNWVGASHYDFLAVYPYSAGAARMSIAGNIAVSANYNMAGGDTPDLMAAGYRRRNNVQNPNAVVALEFQHLTSAVQVVVRNSSDSKSVTVDSWHFKNLTVSGDAKVTLDNFGTMLPSWINTERSTADVKETVVPEGNKVVNAKSSYAGAPNLMIPQRLDQAAGMGGLEADMPKLLLTFTPQGGSQTTVSLTLKDIEREDGTPITSWEMGTKYVYYISMRLDGGVLVTVVTTRWDEDPYEIIEAETPGILVS